MLVNDLDLMLSNATHEFGPLVTTDVEGRYDRKNTVEFVVLHHAKRNSNYTVTITGHSISYTQPYALVISGEIGEFDYMPKSLYPTAKGLSKTAKTTMFTMLCLSCFLTACVVWIGFANPERRSAINKAKDYTNHLRESTSDF